MSYTVIRAGRAYTYRDGARSGIETARAAIRQGPLLLGRGGWVCGSRRYAFKTIAGLIRAGEAVRIGDVVMAVKP